MHASPFAPPTGGTDPFGTLLRRARQGRGLSQLALAGRADTSARHLSFMETGRALPSREMVLRIAERLAVPLRERNAWLVAAGYAPMYRQQPLDHPDQAAARQAVQRVLQAHEPWPALALDRHWNAIATNGAVAPLLAGVAPELLQPPLNVLRLSLHPQGLASRIVNLGQWRDHLLDRLRPAGGGGDPALAHLHDELAALPMPADTGPRLEGEHAGLVVPLLLRSDLGPLHFIGTTTVFGNPVDVSLQELAIETMFPGDEATAGALRRWAQQRSA